MSSEKKTGHPVHVRVDVCTESSYVIARVWFPWHHAQFLWWLKPLSFFKKCHLCDWQAAKQIYCTAVHGSPHKMDRSACLQTTTSSCLEVWECQSVEFFSVCLWTGFLRHWQCHCFISSSYCISSANDIHPYLSCFFMFGMFEREKGNCLPYLLLPCLDVTFDLILGTESLKSIKKHFLLSTYYKWCVFDAYFMKEKRAKYNEWTLVMVKCV